MNQDSPFATPTPIPTPDTNVRLENIQGYFPQVTATPAWTPKTFRDQFAIYRSAGVSRLYVWDTTNSAWHYTTLT